MELTRLMQLARASRLSLGPRLAAFRAWWAKELVALLPRGLREWLRGRRRWLRIDFDGTTAVCTLREPSGDRQIAELVVRPGTGVEPAMLEAIRTAAAGPVREIAVHVPESRVLKRTLTLPLAAEKNLREVLAFEMDRHTPFKAEQVYYGYAVLDRNPAGRHLRIALTLLPRRDVDPLFALLREEGLEPAALCVGDDERIGVEERNLLPGDRRGWRARPRGWPDRALAMLAVFLLSTAIALPFVQRINAVSRLEREVETARAAAAVADEVRNALERRAAEERALLARPGERPSVIQVLDELTRVLPDSTWVNRLELSQGRVRLRGESADASGLATLIEGAVFLRDASFDATVTRDPASAQERFVLSARAVLPEPPP